MEKSEKICMALLRAESEAEVLEIIENTPEMQNPDNWHPLDNRDTNFNQTSNQSSDGAKALTELMTNMVDAMLMRKCLEDNCDPKDKEKAPKTMYEAAQKYFGQDDGGLASLSPQDPWVKEFNKQNNLVVAITGSSKIKDGRPCFTFIDKGEGQKPDDFPHTFLSLSERNKRDISFVQGKYNMGSSGVLEYCGKRWYKLIISRRYDNLSDWGWTLIRQRPTEKDDLPISEYFYPDKNIPQFCQQKIIPLINKEKEEFEDVYLETGTIVKLYDYRTQKFPSIPKLREVFLGNLVETVLPFNLLDCRAKPEPKRSHPRNIGIDPRPFLGMESQIRAKIKKEDEGIDGEDNAIDDTVADAELADQIDLESPNLGNIKIKALLVENGKMPKSLGKDRLFHAVNGQVQFKQTRGVFARMRMHLFMDRLIIVVDSSNLHFNAHNKIWKADRENIKSTDEGDEYKEMIGKYIQESLKLKELHQQLVEKELSDAQSKGTENFMQELVNTDPTLADMLQGKDPTITHINHQTEEKKSFKGKQHPEYLKSNKPERVFDVQPRGTKIVFSTDAEENYLKRENSPGKVIFVSSPDTPKNHFSIGSHMLPGELILYVKPIQELTNLKDEFTFKVGLEDDVMPEPIMDKDYKDGEEATITLKIIDDKNLKKKHKKKPKENPKPDLAVPPHKLMVKDPNAPYAKKLEKHYKIEEWPENFNEEDGGTIRGGGKNAVYCINYDNRYHLDYRKKQKDSNAREVITMKFIMGMLLSMIGFEKALRNFMEKDEDEHSEDDFEEKFRQLAAKGAASTILALSEKLPQVIHIKSVKQQGEEDS